MTFCWIIFIMCFSVVLKFSSSARLPLLSSYSAPLYVYMDVASMNTELEQYIGNEISEKCDGKINLAVSLQFKEQEQNLSNEYEIYRDQLVNTYMKDFLELKSEIGKLSEKVNSVEKLDEWTAWSDCRGSFDAGKRYRIKRKHRRFFQTKPCIEADDVMLDMKFNRTSLHSTLFISDNNKVISSHNTPETTNSGNNDHRLQIYTGIITDRCVQKNTIVYYTVGYQYKITSTHQEKWLMLEFGIAERDKIDNHHSVAFTEVSGWAFYLASCETYNKICVKANHKASIKYQSVISDNSAGTTKEGKFDVMVDRIKNTFSLIENNEVLYTFQGVMSDVDLCPVFGMYNPSVVEVKIEIINSYNLTNIQPLFD